MATPEHRFRVGQSVEYASPKSEGNAPSGAFTVLRLLPNDQMDREYRVQHQRDGHERVAKESQLREGLGSATFDRMTGAAAAAKATGRTAPRR